MNKIKILLIFLFLSLGIKGFSQGHLVGANVFLEKFIGEFSSGNNKKNVISNNGIALYYEYRENTGKIRLNINYAIRLDTDNTGKNIIGKEYTERMTSSLSFDFYILKSLLNRVGIPIKIYMGPGLFGILKSKYNTLERNKKVEKEDHLGGFLFSLGCEYKFMKNIVVSLDIKEPLFTATSSAFTSIGIGYEF